MNLVPLYEEAIQFNNFNGTVLAAGKVEVWYLGRTRKADIYADVAGETPLPNPFDLNDLGMQEVYVNPAFNYTLVVYDAYGAELFSVDKYLQGAGEHITSNVVVQPSEHIGVSAWTVGEVQIYQPYLVGEVGKVYEGIDPIVVNNDVNRISANHIPLGVQDPLYFVEDSETACIIGCSAQTEIPAELSGKWDEASDAVIANSAQWAEGTEYEAGSYVSIDGHTISVTGLSPVPADTASTGLVAQVSADITAMIPDTSDMATQTWVNEQGFLTAHQDISNKLDVSAFSTVSGDFLTAIPSEYVTENTLQSGLSSKLDSTAFSTVSGDFLTAHQSLDGLMSADLLEISDNKITGYNGTAFAGQGGTANPQIPVTSTSGISIFESADKVYFNISADYAFNSDLQSVSAEITGMIPAPFDPTYLSGQIDNKLDSAIYANDSGTFLTALPSDLVYTADIQDMATTGQVAEKLDTTAFSTVSGDFLTAHQDLSDYQTTAGMTAYQPAGSYLTADALDNVSANWNEVSAKLDTTAFSDVSGTFLTAHQDISNKLDTTAFSDVSGNFLTAVPDTYLQNTDLEISDNKITGISGIPLSAGGDVPEGVMAESGLEYNAVQEISGYNGSAIAQYGAEKQWLVHDDTLVHAANSAQYALGVNLSAVAQLLGVDETVLWEGDLTANSTANLTESWKNFEYIKIYGFSTPGGSMFGEGRTEDMISAIDTSYTPAVWNPDICLNTVASWNHRSNFNIVVSMPLTFTADTNVSALNGRLMGYWNGSWQSSDKEQRCHCTKIVGIGRKQ